MSNVSEQLIVETAAYPVITSTSSNPFTPYTSSTSSIPFAWPALIIGIIGLILFIWTLVDGNIDPNRKVFGCLMIFLWTIVWVLILILLWLKMAYGITWWLLVVSAVVIITFFVVIVFINVGNTI